MKPLPTEFDCPFCEHPKTCEVLMNVKAKVGYIECRVCGENFQTSVHNLSLPVDVYADWIDACDEANRMFWARK
ncbi:unnamed protein product [Soboliphyme baturini]|uniref:Transcription elongation factor 1 homolog n=1 Tax=Soboliphyme baturini TaxID=241478 RepID=A0A183IZR9_9BILA|nr:unnamed protein product [Soboliphyme baturini]